MPPIYNFPVRRQPKAKSLPPASDASQLVRAAFRELTELNNHRQMGSWDHRTLQFNKIPRMQRRVGGELVDVAASGIKKAYESPPNPVSPPPNFFCAHTRDNGESFQPLVPCLNVRYEGRRVDAFVAKDHVCRFRVVIPPITPKFQYVQSAKDFEKYEEQRNNTEAPSSSSSSSSSPPPPSQPRFLPFSSSPPTSSPLPGFSPRRPPPGQNTGPQDPTSIFTLAVARARATSDFEIMNTVEEDSHSGFYDAHPDEHPLAKPLHDLHSLFWPYDIKRNADHLVVFNHLNLIDTPTGVAIHHLSSIGIPYSDYCNLLLHCHGCTSCKVEFSIGGYNDHLDEQGRCTNMPGGVLVRRYAPRIGEVEQYQYRTFFEGKRPKHVPEYLEAPAGVAWLEWNSRLGVPADVFTMLYTGIVHCSACDLVRTHIAHGHHLDDEGQCADPGQAQPTFQLVPGGDDFD
ncbi:hypothetical protein C8J57DRAFT_1220350 [Mycena rebaudengoi]|nr:hypothetical protein C8J57DRAFT_1220350 [Mycena rebaudengoi]